MPVYVIGTLKPKNGADFPVVESTDVRHNGVKLSELIEQGEFKGADGTQIFTAGVDVLSNSDVNVSDLTLPDGTWPRVGDVVLDVNGDLYRVAALKTLDDQQHPTVITVSHALSVNLKGAKGDTGAQGLSAFQVWQTQEGNADKTMDDYLAAIKGAKGDKGDKGDAGEAGPAGPQGPQGESGAAQIDDATTTAEDKPWSAKKTNDSIAAVNTSVTTLATNVGDTTVDLVGTFEAALTKAGA